MANSNDILRKVYLNASKHFSLPDFDTFQRDMLDEKKRRSAYDKLQQAYSLPDFDTFSTDIGAVTPPVPAQPTAQAQSQPQTTTATVKPITDTTAQQASIQQPVQTSQTSAQPPQPQGWTPSPMQQQAFQMQVDASNARMKKQSEEFQQRMDGIRKGNRPGAFMGEREFNPQSGQMETVYYTTQGDRVGTPMQQSHANTEYHQWWENNTEAGQRSREKRLQREFDEQLSSFWERHASKEGESAAEKAWSAAEVRQSAARERNAERTYGGDPWINAGREMHIVNASTNKHADRVAYLSNFDLDRLMDDSWDELGEDGQKALIDDCYRMLSRRNPGADALALYNGAKEFARQMSDLRLYNLAVEKNRPKSEVEYMLRKLGGMNVLNNISKGLAVSQANSTGDMAAYEVANEQYRQGGHKIIDVAGTVAGFALDPTLWLTSGVGSAATRAAMWAGVRFGAGRGAAAVTNAAARRFASTLTGRIAGGVAGGAANFGTYEGIKEVENQFVHGGHVVGVDDFGRYINEGYSALAVGGQALHGLIMGGAIGWLGPVTGNVSDKLVKGGGKLFGKEMAGISSAYGKAATRAGLYGASTVAEGTIFSVPEWIEGERDGFDVWTDNMAMMVGFKAPHMLKSAGGVLSDLKAAFDSPANGRKNRLDFESRLRQRMDAPSDGGLALTKDEEAELKRYGYELRDLVESAERTGNAKEGGIIAQNAPEIVSRLTDMVTDPRVSEAARAKMYYYATGRMLPMSTIMRGEMFEDGNGGFVVESQGANGVITSRSFKNRKAADLELERINRQTELNSIELGERYQQTADFGSRLQDACRTVAEENGWDMVEVYRTCEEARRNHQRGGDKQFDEVQQNILRKVTDAMDEFEETGVTDAIRGRINEKYGVDIDAAIRKEANRRTQAEQRAIDEYIGELIPNKAKANPIEDAEAEDITTQKLLTEDATDNPLRLEEPVDPRFEDNYDFVGDEPHKPAEQPIGRAVMKYQDRPVEVLSGRVVMMEDGTMVDTGRSDRSIVIRDVATGKTEMVSPEAILSYEDYAEASTEINSETAPHSAVPEAEAAPQPKYSKGAIKIRNSDGTETRGFLTGEVDENGNHEYYVEGDLRRLHYASDHELDNILSEYIPDRPQEAQPTAPKPDDPNRPKPEGVANVEDYDNGYSNGVETAQNLSDAQLSEGISKLRTDAETLTDFGRGWLEAHEYEQQRRKSAAQPAPDPNEGLDGPRHAQDVGAPEPQNQMNIEVKGETDPRAVVPENAETVPNIGENAEIPTGNRELGTESVPKAEDSVENGGLSADSSGQKPTPLQRIPRNEKGEPVFELAESPEVGWDALVEFSEGDVATAKEIADTMAEEKRKAYEKAQKLKPKGKTPTEILASKKANAAQLAQAESEYNLWQRMAEVEQSRQNAIRSQQETEARRLAAERADADKAEREAREEAARLEREALEGIPEWHMDTPENARKRGARRFSGQMFQRQEPISDAIEGKETEVKFSNKDIVKARYVVIEASQLQPSHIEGVRNPYYFIEETQPKNRVDAASIMAEKEIATNIRPTEIIFGETAYTGAPVIIVTAEGVQGHSRMGALKYLWDNNLPEQQNRYVNGIVENAERLGVDPEKVKTKSEPVLARMIYVDDAEAIRLGQMTAQDTESGGIERIKPKNVAQKLGDDMRTFANRLLSSGDDDASFGQLVDRNGTDVLKWMNQTGAISNTQYQSAFDSKGNLTAEAKNDLQKVLYQAVFKSGSQQLEEMFDKLPAKAQRAILSTAFRDMDSPFAGKMLPEIQSSIMAYNLLMNDPAFADAKNMEQVLRAISAFKSAIALDDRLEQYMPADNFSNFALHLAGMYKASDMSQTTIASYFNQMYDLAQGKKAATLFEEADTTEYPLAEVIKKVLNIEYQPAKNGNNNVANGGADVALRNQASPGGEPRSSEPPASREQTPAGTEQSERGAGAADDSSRETEGELDSVRRIAERHAEIEKHLGIKYSFSQEQANHGEVFYQNEKSSTNLAVIPDEIFDKIGVDPIPFKLTETMAWHVYTNHAKELGLKNLDNAIDFVLDIVNNVDHVRLGKGNTFIFSVENTRKGVAHRAITIVVKADTGEFMGIKTSGFDRMSSLEKRPILWEPGAVSTPGAIATPTVTTIKAQQGDKHMGRAEGQSLGEKSVSASSSDIEAEPEGKRNGTATPQNGLSESKLQTAASQPHGLTSERKVTNSASDKQESGAESSVQPTDNKGEQTIQTAVEAASVEVNTAPTPAQVEAGNYKKGHVTIGEFDITIENPAGSTRKGVDADGKEWSTIMANAYGYIKGTEGVDGDHIDVFLHQDMDSWNGRKVYVVDQINTDGSFDEHKVMLGFNDKDEAMNAYLANYDATWAEKHPGIRISETNIEDFNKWVQSSHRKTKPFADYTSVSKVTEQPTQTSVITGDGYKVEPKPYTNKQGKTLDTYLVTFDRDFSKEEKSALRAKAKAVKGWYDRESGGWMLRSAEDAKAFAEDVAGKSEDDVADEAPLSMADMQKPTDAPVKKVDVGGVIDALKQKGENKLSDHSEPVEQPKLKKRKWISDEDADEFNSLRNDLRNHFGKGDDIVQEGAESYGKPQPKQMDAEVLRMGTRMTYLMMKGGLRSFADYCEAMKDELPDIFDDMRPHLKSLYAAAQNMEEVMQLGWDEEMDDRKTVKAFDVYNFDKPGAKDIIATAQHTVDENNSQQQTDQIIQTLKDQRNEQRKKEADETSADTEAIVSKAEATADEIESKLEAPTTEQDAERLSRSIDKELEEVNKQLALLGYYEADPVDKDFNEAYGYMRNAERKAVQDAHRLATQLANDLGITIDPKDKVRKSKYGFGSKIARSNVAPAGGEVYITLPLTEARELSIWLSLDKNEPWREGGREDRYDEDLMLTGIMYRVENTGKGGMSRYESSIHNTRPTIPYDEFLSDIRRLVRSYLPEEQVKPATTLTPQPGEDMVKMAERVAKSKAPKKSRIPDEQPMNDLFGGLFDKAEPKQDSAQFVKDMADMLERGESPFTVTPEVEAELAKQREAENNPTTQKNNSHEKTDVQARPETAGRGGQQPRPNEPLGTSAEHEAEEKLSEYEDLMKAEMEAKEAKYAELDKEVEAASNIELTEEDSEDAASEPIASYSEENANFASRYETQDGKTINYTSENAEGYGGLFDFDFSGENAGGNEVGMRSGANDLQRQGDTGLNRHDSRLDKETGEFSHVERIFRENGSFNFTSGEKIESADDVAFIFSALEDAAKEHSFVVLVKDGKPTVVELGMGTFTATMVDIPTASLAYNRIQPDQVYFVHNHPSGNLMCSPQDVQMLRKIADISKVPVYGVIINLKTGKYGTFDTDNTSGVGQKRVPENESPLAVHTLDKQIFAPNYDPMEQPLVRGSKDVAKFLNSQRMGDRAKMSFIILSRAGRIVGNIHTPFTKLPAKSDEIARYISERVIQFGGESAILYGDFTHEGSKMVAYRNLKDNLNKVGGTTLLDVVNVEGNNTRSANDDGLLYEPGSEYGASTEAKSSHAERMSKKFNTPIRIVTDTKELTNDNSERQARMRRSKGFYDPATGEVVIVLPNNANVEDVAETVFHEVVAHKGLREMIGEENYDAFCDEVYNHLKNDLKEQVDEETTRRFMNEPGKGYEHHRRVAVDELFGRMAEKGFEDFTKAERGVWAKLKAKVLEAINKFLGALKLPKWVKLGDNELRYMLWRSHERLRAKGDYVDMARDAAKREELGLRRNEAVRVRKSAEAETADRIENLFNSAVAGDLKGKPVEVGRLTKAGREYLEQLSGLKMKEKVSFVLNPSDLVHMYRDHFGNNEKDKGSNIPLTKDDIRAIADVVSHPERIIFGIEPDGLKRNLFYFLAPANEGAYNLLEIYGDRKGNLTAKTFYKTRKGVSQRVLSLMKSEHLTSVTDGATLSDVAKLPKLFENPTIAEDESFDYRFRDGETGDIWKDQSVGLQERITNAAIRLSNNQSGDLTLRNDAMQAIGGNLTSLRKAMAAQRRFDQATVKRVADLARILMQSGYLSDMTSGEIQRLISAVKNSVGHKDVKESVQKIMDIMVNNQLRNGEATLRQILAIRGSKVDARGVEVQGALDVEGQRTMEVVKKVISLTEDDITDRIAEALNRMSDPDQTIADQAAIEYAGLNMALDYVQNIANSKAEEKALRDSLKTAKEDRDAGRMTDDAYKQFVETTEDAIRKNKIERAEAYFNLVGRLSDSLRGSIENAKAFREAEKARVNEIHHNANSDMEGRPTNEHHKDDWKDTFVNNGFVQFLFAPLGTFDQIMRVFGNKSANGEGYLWNRFMRGWVDCRNKELQGVKEKFAQLDEKASELFGKGKTWGDIIRLEGKLPKATVSFWDGGEMRDHELTQGNLLYIYMVDKMTDGRMKLRRMGITEDDITDIENFLDPRFKTLGDWLQDEFLVATRNEYNETHKRMFGASMAAIENYFPLKILANARIDKEEDVNQQNVPEGITTKTGSIIKRRVNNLALDITGADALSVILDHITQMEHWSAYAEWNRDLNTLRTYKRFRNQVINMTTVYGGGRKLWENFNDLCLMAAGEYRPPISRLNKNAVNLAKGVTAAKVSFRMYTALKQFLSAPAYAPEVSMRAIAKSIANPYGDFKWCLENMPIFRERWHSRISGDPRLLKSDMDWKMWRSRIMEISSRIGMTPNAFVDAVTVSIGARAMYETRLKQYLKEGYPADAAEKRAMQDATILFNQTQQSSESPFLSTMQVDKDWLSTLFTVFRNSSMSYTRQEFDAMRNLKRNLTPGQRAKSIEFMTKQILRDWDIDPDAATDDERSKAEDAAKNRFRRQIKKDVMRIATFGFILQALWNLGPYLPYIFFGNNDDEKDKMWDDALTHSYFGSIEGLTGGDVMSSFGNMAASGEWNWNQLSKDMPLASDINSIATKFIGGKNAEAINDILNLIVQMGAGMNPQSITDAAIAITDACGDDPALSHEAAIFVMRVLQVPQSQLDKLYFDEIDMSGEEASKLTPEQLAQRYAEYKVKRGTPLAPWSWGDEERLGKYEDLAKDRMKERLDGQGDAAVIEAYADYEARYKAVKQKAEDAKALIKTDYAAAAQAQAELQQDPNFGVYQRFGNLDKQLSRISKMWLTAKTPEEASLVAETIPAYRVGMVKVLQAESTEAQQSAMSELTELMNDFYSKYQAMQPQPMQVNR